MKNYLGIFSGFIFFSSVLCACGNVKDKGIEGHLMIVAQKDSLFGIWDITNNDWFIPNKYDNLYPFCEGMAGFKKGDLWGFIDTTGKEIIPAKFQDVKNFKQGYAYVKTGELWGIIDKSGKETMEPKFQHIGPYHEGFYEVQSEGGSWNFARPDGTVLYPHWFSYTSFFVGGYASGGSRLTSESTVDCIIDKNGRVNWCDSMFYNIFPFSGHVARASLTKDNRCVVIDTSGHILYTAPSLYIRMGRSSTNGSAHVTIYHQDYYNSYYGMVNPKGKMIIDTIYDDIGSESEGLITIKKGKKYGLADTSGKILIQPSFYFIGQFEEGMAIASVDGKKYGFADKTGKWIIPPDFDEINSYNNGFSTVSNESKYGIIDKKGNYVIPCEYELLNYAVAYGCFCYGKNGKMGVVDITGTELTPAQFDQFYTLVSKMQKGSMISPF